ncbi:hypothetical protein O6H91_09G060100 [Diphasiastrum complanatum]|uniref:Uncharacterized protein n=1 Tax=Diphasiastrum complanatum TaxID=34168 RepID=A0ACC2CPP0_DIPCM|nr:hypothetical protein O6H91_09G060100 [Diphasiastrum complanatum]
METQRLLDALTDHLALYHLSVESKERACNSHSSVANKDLVSCSRDREKVLEWFRGLSTEQRQAALTVVDRPWVTLVLQMQQRLETSGAGYFFVLPDVSSSAPGKSSLPNSLHELRHFSSSKSKGSGSTEFGQGCKKPISYSGFREHQNLGPAIKKLGALYPLAHIQDAPPLPSLCFRKAKGLLGRLSKQQAAGNFIVNNLKAFSSQDGEKMADGAACADPCPALDTITFSAEFVEDVDEFIGAMDTLSYHAFLGNPCISGSSSPWDETQWLKCMGYYTMPAYVVNKLEFALWSGWISALGTKRPSKPSTKSRKAHTSEHVTSSCLPYVYETAALAARICKKRQGCVKWWSKVNAETRKDVFKVALIAATKYEVQGAVRQANSSLGGGLHTDASMFGGIHYRRKKFKDFGGGPVEQSCSGSSESLTLQNFAGLEALLELTELCLKSTSPDGDWLFYSSLNATQSLSDHIVRNVRNNLVKVMNDSAELELICSDSILSKPNKSISEKRRAKREKNTRRESQNQIQNLSVPRQDNAFARQVESESPSKVEIAHVANVRVKNQEKKGMSGKQRKERKVDSATSKRSSEKESSKKVVLKEHRRKEEDDTHLPLSTMRSHCKGDSKETMNSLSIQVQEAQESISNQMPAFSDDVPCSQTDFGSLGISQPDLTVSRLAHQLESSKEVEDSSPVTNVVVERERDLTTSNIQTCMNCTGVSSVEPTSVYSDSSAESRSSSLGSLDAVNKQHCVTKLVTVKLRDDLSKSGPAVMKTSNVLTQISSDAEKIGRVFPFSTFNNEICHLRSLKNQKSGPHQHAAFVLPLSHEWPGSPRTRFSAGVCVPTTTDRLHLDAGRDLPHRLQASFVSVRDPGLACQPVPIENLLHRSAGVQTASASLDWPLFSRSAISVTPTMGYSLYSKEEPAYYSVSPFSPSPFARSLAGMESNGRYRISEDGDSADRFTNEAEYDDSSYALADSDDLDRHTISEEDNERRLQNVNAGYEADYNQIFGGGVMYWTAADYTGMGYSRPGSLSSEDSTWARREADLGLVIDDIVGLPSLTGSYSNLSSGSATLLSSSPTLPSSTLSFENVGGVPASSCLGLSTTSGEKGGKYVPMTPPGIPQKEELQLTVSSKSSRGAVNVTAGEHNLRPVLRPIIVVRDLSLSGQAPKGELTYLHEARSPHMPRGRRDAYRWKRSPSPILRCAPAAPPPPPPPSPVGDVRKRRGFTTVRSGSSSPRHWGLTNWSNKQDFETQEIQWKNLKSEAGSRWRDRCITSTPPVHTLSGTLLYERLLSIPPLAVEQEHPDVALPVQAGLLYNSDPALQLTLSRIQNDLHKEIEAFCLQVTAENLIRKPYVTLATKKVTHALQVLWPRSRTKLFGSNATGLALPNSDVDLVVCLPPVRNLEPIKEAGILEGRNGIKETCLQDVFFIFFSMLQDT